MKENYFIESYAIKDQFATHFLTLTVCGWIDLFTRKVYKDILIDAFKYTQKQNQLILYAQPQCATQPCSIEKQKPLSEPRLF